MKIVSLLDNLSLAQIFANKPTRVVLNSPIFSYMYKEYYHYIHDEEIHDHIIATTFGNIRDLLIDIHKGQVILYRKKL